MDRSRTLIYLPKTRGLFTHESELIFQLHRYWNSLFYWNSIYLKKIISSKAFFNFPTTIPTTKNLFVSVLHGRFVTVQKNERDTTIKGFYSKKFFLWNSIQFVMTVIFIEISQKYLAEKKSKLVKFHFAFLLTQD